jgi:tRNA nucleotidyltransferase (CCA-adding enzyme)
MKGDELVGAITRTDILRSFGSGRTRATDSVAPLEAKRLHDRKKMITRLMEERLPQQIQTILRNLGRVADRMGYSAYAVGGFARDLVMRVSNLDVDVVVEEDGIRFAREVARQFSCRSRIHKKFGTAVLIFPDGTKVDVATARLEYYDSPAALPTVELSSVKRDLSRRDFTINTLAIPLNEDHFGELIDFFGALQDIKEKTIRVLHSLSFVEDPTRIFRAIRFEQRLGFQLGKHTQNLIRNAVKMGFLEKLSGGRVFAELLLIFKEDDPASILRRLGESGLLKTINPSLSFNRDRAALFDRIKSVLSWYRFLFLEERHDPWLVYFLGLFDGLSDPKVEAIFQRLALRGKNRRRILEARWSSQQALAVFHQKTGGKKRRRPSVVYGILESIPAEARLFMMARTDDEGIRRDISLYFTVFRNVRPALGGKDLIAMGFRPGPLFREIMNDLLMARLDQKVKSKDDEVAFVNRGYRARTRKTESESHPSEGISLRSAKDAKGPRKEAADG